MEKNLTHIALFAALIAVLGLVPKLDLASGVPITAQSLGIMLCGTVLGARRGALAVLLFLALTLAGLPLLSGGRGGIGVLAGPSVGYIIGFPIAAFVTGLITSQLKTEVGIAAILGAGLGGVVVRLDAGVKQVRHRRQHPPRTKRKDQQTFPERSLQHDVPFQANAASGRGVKRLQRARSCSSPARWCA